VRYWKGSIALSSIRDYPLLRQVLRSTFITHGQLYEFMRLEYCATSRRAFNNRVLRLVKHDHLIRDEVSFRSEAMCIRFPHEARPNWQAWENITQAFHAARLIGGSRKRYTTPPQPHALKPSTEASSVRSPISQRGGGWCEADGDIGSKTHQICDD